MRLTDRVEQVVVAAIAAHTELAGCEVDHQVQIIHQQTRAAQPTPMLWISLSVQSLALGEWLHHDPIITPDLHPAPEQLAHIIRRALGNLAAARAAQAAPFARPSGSALPNTEQPPVPMRPPILTGR
ncbi:hypothetical protein [Actinomadura violacea]|uniref:Uncharacterized protein n=1 Tax=Actinomadura violacea TaxID=2819934 RepID=A0ABS3RWN4_9ACTN|nr:hypothetical protein [Actinomadura violacea]MBO2461179.1 hypothetical protein [Actinomadura violacea]